MLTSNMHKKEVISHHAHTDLKSNSKQNDGTVREQQTTSEGVLKHTERQATLPMHTAAWNNTNGGRTIACLSVECCFTHAFPPTTSILAFTLQNQQSAFLPSQMPLPYSCQLLHPSLSFYKLCRIHPHLTCSNTVFYSYSCSTWWFLNIFLQKCM